MHTVLSIAGSDCSGGAGIQADIQTMFANGTYAMTVLTALTAQNTMGISDRMDVPVNFVKEQIDSIYADFKPDAVKIGMLGSAENICMVAERLSAYRAERVVLDPVMISSSGTRLISDQAILLMKQKLFPIVTLLTPNIPEAEVLSGQCISSEREMEKAAEIIGTTCHCAVLLKGGHAAGDANDLLWEENHMEWIYGKRIVNNNTHGTGCTLSSAIAANLAKGFLLSESIKRAKAHVSDAIAEKMILGHGNGPLNHWVGVTGTYIGK